MLLKEKLKELRIARKMTQEAVAEHLGISSQTVSKWERGLLSPDINLLPQIAVLYRCSIDSLFDMESCWSDEHRREFENNIRKYHEKKDYEGAYRAWIKEIELRPDNFRNYPDVMLLVLRQRMFDKEHISRMLRLADYAIGHCTDDNIRNEIYRNMLQICYNSEDAEIKGMAKEFYTKMPMMRHSKEIYARFAMDDETYRKQLKWNIPYCVNLAECSIRNLISDDMTSEEKLFYYKNAAKLYECVLDGRFAGFWDLPLMGNYRYMAVCLCEMGKVDEARVYIDRIITMLKKHMCDIKEQPSIFIGDVEPYNYTPYQQSCKSLLSTMLKDTRIRPFHNEIAEIQKIYNEYFE